MTSIEILLVDDHKMLREGLRAILEQESDIEVVGEAADGAEAVAMAAELLPAIVVMDIGMVGMNGIEATRTIRSQNPGTRVVALSCFADKRYVLNMLDAGASGYVLKDAAVEELIDAVRAVSRGNKYLSPEVAGHVVDACITREAVREPAPLSLLGRRERQVLQLLAEGLTSRQIGERLQIVTKTVETHRRNIMRKLGLHSVAQLTKWAVREGLTSLEV